MSTRLKVGFVTVLSCLTLLLGLFATTGIASAHSTQALQSQTTQASASSTLADDRCERFWVWDQGWGGNGRGDNGWGRMGRMHRRGHFEMRCHRQRHRGDFNFGH
jgi:hypothetical protein